MMSRYEVGEKLGLNASKTDHMVKQLSEMGMIKIMEGQKIILTQKAFAIIDGTGSSN